jgi:hypothetical protein
MDSSRAVNSGSNKKFLLLPNDILRFLFNYLRGPEKCNIMLLNKKFYSLVYVNTGKDIHNYKYIHDYIYYIIKYDYINLLKKIKRKNIFPDLCTSAARYGSINVLKWAHINGYKWNESTCGEAAKARSLECLKYLHENG